MKVTVILRSTSLSAYHWVVELGNGSPYTGGGTGAERPDVDERRAERALTVTPICFQKPIF